MSAYCITWYEFKQCTEYNILHVVIGISAIEQNTSTMRHELVMQLLITSHFTQTEYYHPIELVISSKFSGKDITGTICIALWRWKSKMITASNTITTSKCFYTSYVHPAQEAICVILLARPFTCALISVKMAYFDNT